MVQVHKIGKVILRLKLVTEKTFLDVDQDWFNGYAAVNFNAPTQGLHIPEGTVDIEVDLHFN